jgi:hypothetical protein
MKYILLPILIFWGMWLIWYVSGGPLRTDKISPFIGPGSNGELEYSDEYKKGSIYLEKLNLN